MSYKTSLLVGVLALTFAFASADAAQRAKPEPPPPPPQFHVDAPTRTLVLAKIASSIPGAAEVGKFQAGCNILSALRDAAHGAPVVVLHPQDALGGTKLQDYANIFAGEMSVAGYKIPDSQQGNLFAEANATHAELDVGAGITEISANGCFDQIFGSKSAQVEATVTIDWQVFDPLEKKLLFRATNTGHAKLSNNTHSTTYAVEGVLAAFRDAAKSILADPAFVEAVKDVSVNAPAPADNGLMIKDPAPQPSAALEIPRVPLRTAAFKDQIPDLRQQVVTVMTPEGSGSGFYIADGLLLTNHHVIAGFTKVKVRFFGSRELPGEVLASDQRRDVALVKVEGGGMTGLPIQFDRPQVGGQVYVIGSPLGKEQEGSVTGGIVGALRNTERGPVIQADVAVNHGNSGGPMFDDKGNVIGIVDYGKIDQQTGQAAPGLNFFISLPDALRVLHIAVAGMSAAPAPKVMANAREINVSMYPADGPLKKSGKTQALTGKVGGVGTAGSFAFTRPDGVSCDGKWTTLQSQPQADSLIVKYHEVTGISSSVSGMVGGLAVGACSNSATFQAEYYVVPTADSGFGVATDSNGNVYKLIF